MTRLITPAMVLATLALAACGEAETTQTSARATATPAAGDPERYCALTREMDAAGTKFFARLERKQGKEEPTAEDYEAAERAFVKRFASQFEAIEEAAPAEIRDDIEILLAGQRQRAGLGGSLDQAQVSAAERRVRRYERRRCG
jgi:hypothetical protein